MQITPMRILVAMNQRHLVTFQSLIAKRKTQVNQDERNDRTKNDPQVRPWREQGQ